MYPRSKYRNTKVIVNGIKFDSKLEANLYLHLCDLLEQGIIDTLELQNKFVLADSFKIDDETTKQGYRTIREIAYKCDFVINKTVVMDAKGMKTPVFKIKEKLFIKRYYDQYGEIVCIGSLKKLKEYCKDKGLV